MIVGTFILSLLVFTGIGALAVIRKKTSTTDHLLTSRAVPAWLVALSAVATLSSAAQRKPPDQGACRAQTHEDGRGRQIRELGAPILAAFEALQDKDPPEGDPELRQAVHCLVRLRDQLIVRQRAGDEDCGRWLDRTNAILSGVFGAEYPVGGVPWQRIDATRDAPRELLEDARANG